MATTTLDKITAAMTVAGGIIFYSVMPPLERDISRIQTTVDKHLEENMHRDRK